MDIADTFDLEFDHMGELILPDDPELAAKVAEAMEEADRVAHFTDLVAQHLEIFAERANAVADSDDDRQAIRQALRAASTAGAHARNETALKKMAAAFRGQLKAQGREELIQAVRNPENPTPAE